MTQEISKFFIATVVLIGLSGLYYALDSDATKPLGYMQTIQGVAAEL